MKGFTGFDHKTNQVHNPLHFSTLLLITYISFEKKANRSESVKLPCFYVHNNPTAEQKPHVVIIVKSFHII